MTSASTSPAPVVLVVEDDRDVREAIQELLADDGYRALGAANGREALELLEQIAAGSGDDGLPSLMLVDLLMPVMGGLELVEQLEHHPRLSSIPLVVMTAGNERMIGGDLHRPVLYKPVDFALLSQLLARYCSHPGAGVVAGDPAAPADSGP